MNLKIKPCLMLLGRILLSLLFISYALRLRKVRL